MYKSIIEAIVPSKKPHESPQKERVILHNAIEKQRVKNTYLPPFSDAVRYVNNCLITHNHKGLSSRKAEQYIKLTERVTSGEESNSSAFFTSSVGWLSEAMNAKSSQERKEAIVGAIMNFSGCMASGAIDHKKMKGVRKSRIQL